MPNPSSSVVLHDLSFTWPDGTPALERVCGAFGGRTGLLGTNGARTGRADRRERCGQDHAAARAAADAHGACGLPAQRIELDDEATANQRRGHPQCRPARHRTRRLPRRSARRQPRPALPGPARPRRRAAAGRCRPPRPGKLRGAPLRRPPRPYVARRDRRFRHVVPPRSGISASARCQKGWRRRRRSRAAAWDAGRVRRASWPTSSQVSRPRPARAATISQGTGAAP